MTQKKRTGLISILVGPALFLVLLAIPIPLFSFAGRVALGCVVWMAYWWITRPVHIGVTALLPIVVNAIFNVVPMDGVIANYASEIVLLVLGADIITLTWEETGLDQRLALKALCWIGTSLRQQIVVWFVVSAGLSVFLPNIVVCAILSPVAVSMLQYIGEGDIAKSKIATVILLAIAWGSGLGGAGSPLGGAMNLVAVDALEEVIGGEFMYGTWMGRVLPLMLVLVFANIIYLFLIKPKIKTLKGTSTYFKEMYHKLPKMNRGEKISLILFGAAVVLAFTRTLYADILPGLKPAYSFLFFGILTFVFTKEDGERLMTWERAERRIMWGLIYLFAGGLAVGYLVSETGAAASIAQFLTGMNLTGGFTTILVLTTLTVVIANISSNTAAAAICVPIVVGTVQALGLNPVPYIYITVLAFNSAYVLPTSVRAIPVGYGMEPKVMFKNGLAIAIISIVLITIMGVLAIEFWPGFGFAG